MKRQTPVPEPMSWPRYLPLSIGPPETTNAGTSQRTVPITKDGVVLSQPHNRTTPSIGFARIDRSTSMLTRLRNGIAVGRMFVSPSDVTENSRGNPRVSQTPRFTSSAIWRKCALHGVSSDQVLQIPITGRPSNTWSGNAWLRIQLRCTKPSLSVYANHAAERYLRFSSGTNLIIRSGERWCVLIFDFISRKVGSTEKRQVPSDAGLLFGLRGAREQC